MVETYLLPGDGIHPEGITEDPDGVTFYVSSAKQGTIFRGRLDSEWAQVWQPAGVDGRTGALGMAVDGRGRLLVCGYLSGILYCYDTGSGKLVARPRVPVDDSLLNDVCVADGFAYVTDSSRPVIWRYALGASVGEPQEWIDLGGQERNPYLNGIVAVHDGATLLVAAQGTEELWRVDVASRTAERLDVALSADGMVVVGDMLYTCDNAELDNGDLVFYVSAFRLSADGRSLDLVHRWERSTADTPTTLAYLGERLLVVNSQFVAGRQGTASAPFTVSAIPLS